MGRRVGRKPRTNVGRTLGACLGDSLALTPALEREIGRTEVRVLPWLASTFLCYSRGEPFDEQWTWKLVRLITPLLERAHVELFHDRLIRPGEEWNVRISNALASCRFAIIMVTPELLVNRFVMKHELPALSDPRREGAAAVIPFVIHLRRSRWMDVPPVARLQAAHDMHKPLLSLRDDAEREEVLFEISERMAYAFASLSNSTPAAAATPSAESAA